MGWNVQPTDWEDCHAGIFEPDANSYVAVVLAGPDSEAHTNLIAAAPDMLAALEEIESLPVDDYGCREIPPGFLDKARAAIAKAKGE